MSPAASPGVKTARPCRESTGSCRSIPVSTRSNQTKVSRQDSCSARARAAFSRAAFAIPYPRSTAPAFTAPTELTKTTRVHQGKRSSLYRARNRTGPRAWTTEDRAYASHDFDDQGSGSRTPAQKTTNPKADSPGRMLRQASHVVGWPKLKCSLPVAVTAQPRSMRVSVTAAPIPLVPPITRARFVLTLPLIARLQDSLGYPGGTAPVDRGRVRE